MFGTRTLSWRWFVVVSFGVLCAVGTPRAQLREVDQRITSPLEQFGHSIGDDYFLINYTQYADYLRKLDAESDRLSLVDIGPTEEGRRELMVVITSPQNHARLKELQAINRRLALAEGLDDEQARELARRGKTVVWIDGGLHATEVLGAQQLVETIYRLTAKEDPETRRIMDDDIVLCTLVNPDGMELVSNWYMRETDETKRSLDGLPRLYQKYIGHDNNRDFYMMNMVESVNANRVLYREWFPAITFNHHQTGPDGAVLFAPPFRDPFNYNFDPLVVLGIDLVGSAIHTRLAAENKPGAVMRSAAPYSTWFNGSIRTTAYFHNQIGILTETIGSPTPTRIPFVPEMQLPRADAPNPIAPQPWHFRQSVEYSVTTNLAVLDLASKRREDFLFNLYRMARNAIERGNRDSWTVHPVRIDAARAALAENASRTVRTSADVYGSVLRDPRARDARGFIIPSDQPDFLTATKFINALIQVGVTVHRATGSFSAGEKTYPAGSYVVKAAQPFRAHVMDMFEPQDYPDDIPHPGAPPTPPYDATGYNLSYSMGIVFDRLLEGFDGPFEVLNDVVPPPRATLATAPADGGYLLRHEVNDAFIAVNRLLKADGEIYWLQTAMGVDGERYPAGTMFVPAKPGVLPILQKLTVEKGLRFAPIDAAQRREVQQAGLRRLRPVQIGLWDQYGGSMPSGWMRWLLEQFEFPFDVVYPRTLDTGDLNARFDVLLFVTGAIPERDDTRPDARRMAMEAIPQEYRERLGRVTVSRTVPAIREFLYKGGTVLAIGSSTVLGRHLGLPIQDALVERVGGADRPLPRAKHYVPGSLLDARVDNTLPLAYGMGDRAMVFSDSSPAFRLPADAAAQGITAIAWYDSPTPLRSGWAWGQHYLNDAVVVVDAKVGQGHLVLFANEIAWRAQPHGTFKLLFNGIYHGGRDR